MKITFVVAKSISDIVEFERELQPNEIIPRKGDRLFFSREELDKEYEITVDEVVFDYGNEDKLRKIIVNSYIPEEDNE